jgi:hypothetical protein
VVDKMAALFVQESQLASLHGVGLPGTQMLAMLEEQVQEQIGIDGIILGAAGVKRFAEAGQCS